MADFLNRLIERTSGQTPAIRPLVRSAYSELQPINQAASEFDESVIFNEKTGTLSAASRMSGTPQIESAETTGTNSPAGRRIDFVPKNDREKQTTPDMTREQTGFSHQNTGAKENISQRRKVTSEKVTGTTVNERKIDSREELPVKPEKQLIPELKIAAQNKIPGVQKRNLVPAPSIQIVTKIENSSNIASLNADNQTVSDAPLIKQSRILTPTQTLRTVTPGSEAEVNNQAEMAETVPETARNLVKNYLPEAGPVSRNERIMPETVREAIPARQEPDPPTNIKVTIGRVEIKAIRQPERQIPHTPSVPRKPVISLEAYLQGRDEEGR